MQFLCPVLSLEELPCQEAIPSFSGGRCDRLQLIVFTSRWQDGPKHNADCFFENSWISSEQGPNRAEGKQKIGRGWENLIEIVRNELIVYFISLHRPQGRRHLTYSRAVYLPKRDCLSHSCPSFLSFPTLGVPLLIDTSTWGLWNGNENW